MTAERPIREGPLVTITPGVDEGLGDLPHVVGDGRGAEDWSRALGRPLVTGA
jgi:hypothetical protein